MREIDTGIELLLARQRRIVPESASYRLSAVGWHPFEVLAIHFSGNQTITKGSFTTK